MGISLGTRIKRSVKKITTSMTTVLLLIIAYCIMDLIGMIGKKENGVFALVFFVLSLIYKKKDDIKKFFAKQFLQTLGTIKRGILLDRLMVVIAAGIFFYYTIRVGLPIKYNIGMGLFLLCVFVVKFGITRWIRNHGIDMIIEKDGIMTAVQTKRYTRNVGPAAVREVLDGKAYYECDEAVVVTNRNYTKGAIELGKNRDVGLFGREWLRG